MDRNTIPLPPNATRLERSYVESGGAPLQLDIPIDRFWDAWRCPAAFLPHLAYALSVDVWDDGWDEIRQREAIAESPDYHRRKGTRDAIERAIAYTRRTATVLEWHEYTTPRRRGTFDVLLHLEGGVTQFEAGIEASERALIRRLVQGAKPKSRAFTIVASHVAAIGVSIGVGIIVQGGAVMSVPPDDITLTFSPFVALQTGAGAPLEVSA